MKNGHIEYLRCSFTPEELAQFAKDLARSAQTKATIEQQKKEIDADLKAKIEAENSAIGKLSGYITSGFEYRNVDCSVEFDRPKKGLKRIIRTDTLEEVKVLQMTEVDRQTVLEFQEQK